MTTTSNVEVWLRGPVDGYDPLLMPAVHAFLQVKEDLARLLTIAPADQIWLRPGGAASIGFHVRHVGGVVDRLLTYARGESLTIDQTRAMRAEGEPGEPPAAFDDVVHEVTAILDRALAQLRSTSAGTLLQERRVGRAGLPSTVLGLIFHAAEHATRHVGQAITTVRILSDRQPPAA